MSEPRITLDQWAALVAVVEAGGYAQASARLHRTQSTVTYTIKRLEELLGVKVFELQGRKAALTPTGQALYRRGKALLDEAARVERAGAVVAAVMAALPMVPGYFAITGLYSLFSFAASTTADPAQLSVGIQALARALFISMALVDGVIGPVVVLQRYKARV